MLVFTHTIKIPNKTFLKLGNWLPLISISLQLCFTPYSESPISKKNLETLAFFSSSLSGEDCITHRFSIPDANQDDLRLQENAPFSVSLFLSILHSLNLLTISFAFFFYMRKFKFISFSHNIGLFPSHLSFFIINSTGKVWKAEKGRERGRERSRQNWWLCFKEQES